MTFNAAGVRDEAEQDSTNCSKTVKSDQHVCANLPVLRKFCGAYNLSSLPRKSACPILANGTKYVNNTYTESDNS
eukprot:5930900-Amphidinium_carterae.1